MDVVSHGDKILVYCLLIMKAPKMHKVATARALGRQRGEKGRSDLSVGWGSARKLLVYRVVVPSVRSYAGFLLEPGSFSTPEWV